MQKTVGYRRFAFIFPVECYYGGLFLAYDLCLWGGHGDWHLVFGGIDLRKYDVGVIFYAFRCLLELKFHNPAFVA